MPSGRAARPDAASSVAPIATAEARRVHVSAPLHSALCGLARYVVVTLAAVVGIPFVVSSPPEPGFWVALVAVVAVMLPLVCVTLYFRSKT